MKHLRTWHRILLGLMLLVLIATLALVWANRGTKGSVALQGQWKPINAQPQVNQLETSGKLMPAKTVEIPSPAAGVIASLAVALGDEVSQGQHIARIDSPELAAQLRTAQATMLRQQLQDGAVLAGQEHTDVLNARRRLLTAQAAMETAQARQQESEVLFGKGFLSRNDNEAAKAEVKNAEQQVILAQEELKSTARKFAPDQLRATKLEAENKRIELTGLQGRLGQLTLKSPLAGVILALSSQDKREEGARELAVGSRVAADQAVVVIGDTSSFLIRGNCTEADSVWLEPGADVQVILGALPEQSFTAKVTKVLSQIGSLRSPMYREQEASCEFLVAFPALGQPISEAQRRKIRLGSIAKLTITQTSANRHTSIPLAAVIWAQDGAAQIRWRATATDEPKLIPVRIAQSGLAEVLLRDTLEGEVWVPGEPAQTGSTNSRLKQVFGFGD